MKLLTKIAKTFILLLIATLAFSSHFVASAVSQTIELGTGEQLQPYIGTAKFTTKVMKDGTLLYCLNIHKDTAKNTTAKLVGERDAGVAYIIINGYPNKTFTGDKYKDYYITQSAMWWYLDNTTGSKNLKDDFKTTAADPHNLRPTIKALVEGAEKAKKDGYQQTVFQLTTTSDTLKLENDYYISEEITTKKATNVSTYTVSVTGINNAEIIDSTGAKKTSFAPGDKFRVKVPVASLTSTEVSLTVKATAKGTIYKAYEYQPVDPALQPITPCIPEKEEITASADLKFGISSSKVSILKVDSKTNQPLAGATLVLKDSKDKVITSWTTTTEQHIIRNLLDGKYTITETLAPTGYELKTDPVEFEITEKNRSIQINFENIPKQSVVNILKIDKSTGQPLAGATLVIKDSTGREVASFISSETPYVITDLENGTYTLEEVTAPLGYKKSTEIKSFTISDDNMSHQLIFENYPEVDVPDTTSSSIIFILLGVGIVIVGIGYVYKNGKHAKTKKAK